MSPINPSPVRIAAWPASASLGARQAFDKKLLPPIAVYRAYAGMFRPSRSFASTVIFRMCPTRVLTGCSGTRSYLGPSPARAPGPAPIAFPVATPVSRIPYRLRNPSQCGPYSRGELNKVPHPALMRPPTIVAGPAVLFANHFSRSEAVGGWYVVGVAV